MLIIAVIYFPSFSFIYFLFKLFYITYKIKFFLKQIEINSKCNNFPCLMCVQFEDILSTISCSFAYSSAYYSVLNNREKFHNSLVRQFGYMPCCFFSGFSNL